MNKKTKQKDLANRDLRKPDVSEDIKPVSYIALRYATDKFELKIRDTALTGLDRKELMKLVRQRIRPLTGAEIAIGDYDAACKKMYAVLVDYPR